MSPCGTRSLPLTIDWHVDEHHEELKGSTGWSTTTRRSLSWLVYLNEPDWNANHVNDGGSLRVYERSAPPRYRVGARRSGGDLQIGWLRPTLSDPCERPVFLNAQYHDGNCAMYIDGDDGESTLRYITDTFPSHPTLFVAGGFKSSSQQLVCAEVRRRHRLGNRRQKPDRKGQQHRNNNQTESL